MSLLIKLFIEEREKQLNIIIWNDENGQIKFADNLSSPVANLKIPLNVSSDGGHVVSGNSWKEFTVRSLNDDSRNKRQLGETSESQSVPNDIINNRNEERAHQNDGCGGPLEEHQSSSNTNSKTKVAKSTEQICIETNKESKNEMIENPISEKRGTEESSESDNIAEANKEKSMTNTTENFDDPFSINKFLSRLKKKCGAVGNAKQKSCVCEGHKKTSKINTNNVNSTEMTLNCDIDNTIKSIGNNSSQIAGTSQNISTDRMSICSDNDYTLMIDEEPEKEYPTKKLAVVPGDSIENQERNLDTYPHNSIPAMKKKQSIYHCTLCDRDFKRASNHKSHMVSFHGLKFTCPICDAAFELRTQFSLHLRNHCIEKSNIAGTKTKKWLLCKHCGYKSKCLDTLLNHSKKHVRKPSRWFWRVSN